MFNHHVSATSCALRRQLDQLGRIAAQVVYYFTAASRSAPPGRSPSPCRPAIGDILAGYVAKRMGLPIERLASAPTATTSWRARSKPASTRCAASRRRPRPRWISRSPRISSAAVRGHGRDGAAVRRLMQSLQQSGRFEIAVGSLAHPRDFDAHRARRGSRRGRDQGELARCRLPARPAHRDRRAPHRAALEADPATPTIVLGTAHPAKFPAAEVARRRPAAAGPSRRPDGAQGALTPAAERPRQIEAFVRRARAGRGAAA
jgi:threonine synthase